VPTAHSDARGIDKTTTALVRYVSP
jgi:hypothetical protein